MDLGPQLQMTTVHGVWLYLYLVVDAWSRKVMAWDLAEVESAGIPSDLVQQALLQERYLRFSGFDPLCQQQTFILHADYGNARRGPTLESRLDEMGVGDPCSGRRPPTKTVLRILVPNRQILALSPKPASCLQ
jgi:transposase InsO family protein